jgi:hypothetical protein
MPRDRFYDRFKYPSDDEEGIPDEVRSGAEALGNVVIAFADLEEQLALSVSFLIGRTDAVGNVVTAELSFKTRLHVFASLFRLTRPHSENLPRLDDLIAVFDQAEQLRNQIVHSSWQHDFETMRLTRRKRTAKMSKGYRTDEESLTPAQIQSVAHHFGYLGFIIDELLYLEFGSEYGSP